MGPLVFQLVQDVDIAEWTQDVSHQSRFANGALNRIKPRPDCTFRTDHSGDGAGHLAEDIISACHGLLAGRHCICDLLCCLQSWIDYRHGDHHDTMLDALRKAGDFWEEALVCWTRHDLMWISLTPTIGTNNCDGRTEEFDEMPTRSGDGEHVCIGGDVAEDLKRSVVLEEKIHLYTNATDVLKHVAKLHVFWI